MRNQHCSTSRLPRIFSSLRGWPSLFSFSWASFSAAGVLALAPACQSDGGPPEMTRDQKVELYSETASYLYEDGSFLRAQDQAVKALKLDPDNLAMRRMIGWIRLRMGSTQDLTIAEDFFRALERDGDTHPAAVQGLATVCERLGVGYEKAARDFASGERLPQDGSDPEAAARSAQAKALDYWSEAEELYLSTLTDGEGSTRAKNGLQRVYAYTGEYEKSLAMSDEVLNAARAELAQWRKMLTATDLGERDEKLMRTNEEAATDLLFQTHLFAANLLFDLGRFEDALENIEEATVLNPLDPEVYSVRGQLRAKLGDCQGAIEDIDRYLQLSRTPLEHPDIKRAFDLRRECQEKLAQAD